jgi:hypothetical protein
MAKAWHFVDKTLRDRRPIPPDGEWLKHDRELVMCQSGLHASTQVIDALVYAPGDTLCRVEVGGEIIYGGDKLVATERRILWRIDAKNLLREAARLFALEVIDLWDDPPKAVREYLITGSPRLQLRAALAARAMGARATRAAARATAEAARAAGDAAGAIGAAGAAGDAALAARAAAEAAGAAGAVRAMGARAAAEAVGAARAARAMGARATRTAGDAARATARQKQHEILLSLVARERGVSVSELFRHL